MATSQLRWIRNLFGATEPLRMLGLFGTGTAIKKGEILELTGNTNTEWVPLDSDFNMAANIAVADVDIAAGDRTGYYPIIVPRPGDVFEFELATADDPLVGAALYYSSSEKLTTTAGTNPVGYAVGQEHYPDEQGHVTVNGAADAGSTVGTTSYVRMCFALDASYAAAFNKSA